MKSSSPIWALTAALGASPTTVALPVPSQASPAASVARPSASGVDALVVSAEYASSGGLWIVLNRGTQSGIKAGTRGAIYQSPARVKVLRSPITLKPASFRVVDSGAQTSRAKLDVAGITVQRLNQSPYARLHIP